MKKNIKKISTSVLLGLLAFFLFNGKASAWVIQNKSTNSPYENYAQMPNLVKQGTRFEVSMSTTNYINFGYNNTRPLLTDGSCNSDYTSFPNDNSKHCFFRSPSKSNAGDYLDSGLALYDFDAQGSNIWFSHIYQLEEKDYLQPGVKYTLSFDYAFRIDETYLTLDHALKLTDITSAGNVIANYLLPNEHSGQWSKVANYERTYSVVNDVVYYNTSVPYDYVFINITFDYTPVVVTENLLMQIYAPGFNLSFGSIVSELFGYYYPKIYVDMLSEYVELDVPVTSNDILFSGVSSGNIMVKNCWNPANPTDYVPFRGDFFYFNSNYADLTYLPYENIISRTILHNFYEYEWLEGFNFNLYGDTGWTGILYTPPSFPGADELFKDKYKEKNFFDKVQDTLKKWKDWLFNATNEYTDEQSEYMYVCTMYIPKNMYYSEVIGNSETTEDGIYTSSFDFSYKDSAGQVINVDDGLKYITDLNMSKINSSYFNEKFENSLNIFSSGFSTLSSTLTIFSEHTNPIIWAFIILFFIILFIFFFLRSRK